MSLSMWCFKSCKFHHLPTNVALYSGWQNIACIMGCMFIIKLILWVKTSSAIIGYNGLYPSVVAWWLDVFLHHFILWTQTFPLMIHGAPCPPGTAGWRPQFGAALRLDPQHRPRPPWRRGTHGSNGPLRGAVPGHNLPVEAGALRVLQADLPSRAAGNASAGLRLGVNVKFWFC